MTTSVSFKLLYHSPKLTLKVCGVILIYILAFQFGIRKTIIQFSKYVEMNHTAEKQSDITDSPEELNNRLGSLDRLMGCSELDANVIRQSILERLSRAGKSFPFTMVDIPEGYVYDKQGYTVIVNTFVMTGKYQELLRLLYCMDTARAPGSVVSSRMYFHKTYQLAIPELRLAIFFQHLKKNNNVQK